MLASKYKPGRIQTWGLLLGKVDESGMFWWSRRANDWSGDCAWAVRKLGLGSLWTSLYIGEFVVWVREHLKKFPSSVRRTGRAERLADIRGNSKDSREHYTSAMKFVKAESLAFWNFLVPTPSIKTVCLHVACSNKLCGSAHQQGPHFMCWGIVLLDDDDLSHHRSGMCFVSVWTLGRTQSQRRLMRRNQAQCRTTSKGDVTAEVSIDE